MPVRFVVDTHAILWYLYDDSRLSVPAAQALDDAIQDGDQIAIAAITLAEIVYLAEKGRISSLAFDRVRTVIEQPGAMLVQVPFDLAIAESMREIDRMQVPELPDRVIAATAHYLGVPVISRDHKIRSSIVPTIW
ncbi:MAG: PIN domain-containing protein [Anaerolineales bacterium]|nr:PIN domain-containing protein [Anaerolineales bacterium]